MGLDDITPLMLILGLGEMLVIRRLFVFILLILLPPYLLLLITSWPPERTIANVGIYLMLLSVWATVLLSFSQFLGYDLQSLFALDKSEESLDTDRNLQTDPPVEQANHVTGYATPTTHENETTEMVDARFSEDTPNAYLVALADYNPFLPEIITLYKSFEIRIGRSPKFCDIVLNDMRISRIHATIFYESDTFRIRDEASSGGTYINQIRLKSLEERQLELDDVIHFSTLTYRFEPIRFSNDNSSINLLSSEIEPEIPLDDPTSDVNN